MKGLEVAPKVCIGVARFDAEGNPEDGSEDSKVQKCAIPVPLLYG